MPKPAHGQQGIDAFAFDDGFNEVLQISVPGGINQIYVDSEKELVAIMASYQNAIFLTNLDGEVQDIYPLTTSGYPYAVALDIQD